MRVVAVDQGTTSTRALLVNDDGQPRLVASVPHKQYFPQAGWVEHDPQELLAAIKYCLTQAGRSDAIGLANQGESCLAWDGRTKQPISPVIVWQDNRTEQKIASMRSEGLEAITLQRSGLPLDSYFSASKLAWLFNNVDQAKSLAQSGHLRLGTTDAFFLDVLADEYVTDLSTASRTGLLNLETGDWDETLCDLFGVPGECLPRIVDTVGAIGTIKCAGTYAQVVTSIVDQQAALYGHGCRKAGDIKITFGTGAFALMLADKRPDLNQMAKTGLLPTVAWKRAGEPPMYAFEGGVFTASAALNWAQRAGLVDSDASFEDLPQDSALTRGLAFVPAFAGLACPYWRRDVRGTLLGLSLDTTKQDIVLAIIEGVACRGAEVIESLHAQGGYIPVLRIDGGLSANVRFRQVLADVTGHSVIRPSSGELTAEGVLQLAAQSCGANVILPKAQQAVAPRDRPQGRQMLATFKRAVALACEWPGVSA